ncbi:MAG: hypothetical protein R3321_10010 [Nitrososphaeraceae archaeon]|nr:hypothetical protein [Nitrososphaeraceae archaeon]
MQKNNRYYLLEYEASYRYASSITRQWHKTILKIHYDNDVNLYDIWGYEREIKYKPNYEVCGYGDYKWALCDSVSIFNLREFLQNRLSASTVYTLNPISSEDHLNLLLAYW